ncbi:VOC family protein [Virgibacillus byunsanensis]|uniref:VOC family protein n=1 Tax=Virgibacillus byunsanensis TaxID=570945 RepID=A0ABW3LL66_9BACI
MIFIVNKIHHIAFLVRDLNKAIHLYKDVLNMTYIKRFYFDGRGAEVALFQVSGVILELICPKEKGFGPYNYLEKHGEGFFHIAFEVDDVISEMGVLNEKGFLKEGAALHEGIDWELAWMDSNQTMGVPMQIVTENKNND